MSKLFCFGLGFSAAELATRLQAQGWKIAGTVRSEAKAAELALLGYEMALFDAAGPVDRDAILTALDGSTHLLLSIPPEAEGDPALVQFGDAICALPALDWIGYLSTVGVYGDHEGAWVDEETPPKPGSGRTGARLAAEQDWLTLGKKLGIPAQVFRLAGIYGPGRSQIDRVRDGSAHRIVKPGQVFSRIHVADIASVLEASIAKPREGAIYNVADDEPAPPQDVVTYAAELLGVAPPPEVPFEEADLTPMARSFYADRRRIANRRIKEELGVELAYPTYREGLAALL